MKVVSWFSAGVSSAIATKLAIEKYEHIKIIYIDIEDQHIDSLRFVNDCEIWFGKEIEIISSPYKNVSNVIKQFRYVNGVGGARCTDVLKKRVRKEWEFKNKPDCYVWGMDSSKREQARAERLVDAMPNFRHEFPLIENNITKEIAHGMLAKAGIKRPVMYDLGFPNNNCIGCVKGGKGYWNLVREHFPEAFANRSRDERLIGHSCIKGVFLDELAEDEGRELAPIVEDCGIFCELKI